MAPAEAYQEWLLEGNAEKDFSMFFSATPERKLFMKRRLKLADECKKHLVDKYDYGFTRNDIPALQSAFLKLPVPDELLAFEGKDSLLRKAAIRFQAAYEGDATFAGGRFAATVTDLVIAVRAEEQRQAEAQRQIEEGRSRGRAELEAEQKAAEEEIDDDPFTTGNI